MVRATVWEQGGGGREPLLGACSRSSMEDNFHVLQSRLSPSVAWAPAGLQACTQTVREERRLGLQSTHNDLCFKSNTPSHQHLILQIQLEAFLINIFLFEYISHVANMEQYVTMIRNSITTCSLHHSNYSP